MVYKKEDFWEDRREEKALKIWRKIVRSQRNFLSFTKKKLGLNKFYKTGENDCSGIFETFLDNKMASIKQSNNQSIKQSFKQSVKLSIIQLINQSITQSTNQSLQQPLITCSGIISKELVPPGQEDHLLLTMLTSIIGPKLFCIQGLRRVVYCRLSAFRGDI